jgi:hypothetical protein
MARERSTSTPVTEEARLAGLLRQAECYAYALAHGYDVGGEPHRAYGFVALAERLRDTALEVSDLARPTEPESIAPAFGLRSRASSLRGLLRGATWQGQGVVPLMPRPGYAHLCDLSQVCIGYQLKTLATVDRSSLSEEDRVSVYA